MFFFADQLYRLQRLVYGTENYAFPNPPALQVQPNGSLLCNSTIVYVVQTAFTNSETFC